MESSLVLIQGELEKARERLKGVEDNIKKSIGREIGGPRTVLQSEKRPVKRKWPADEPEGVKDRPRLEREGTGIALRGVRGGARLGGYPSRYERTGRNPIKDNDEPRVSAKKRLGEPTTVTVFSRLSGPPKDDDLEPTPPSKLLTSQVVTPENAPSRKDILAAQSGDNACRARNRRMFGSLLGTLRKFRQEEDALKEKEEMRANVERKLEEAATREKEEVRKQRQELFTDRRKRKFEIRQLEFKLARLKQFSEWKTHKKYLMNFIRTKACPQIFYSPKVHNDKTTELLEETKKSIEEMIAEKKQEVEKMIDDHEEKNKAEEEQEKAAKKTTANEIEDDEELGDGGATVEILHEEPAEEEEPVEDGSGPVKEPELEEYRFDYEENEEEESRKDVQENGLSSDKENITADPANSEL